jgi:filamentous hemagglutinin family protein
MASTKSLKPLPRPAWAACLIALLLLPVTRAEVITDGTLGTATTLPGPDFVISEGLGRRAGGNLFHSFSRFSIAAGESATFTGEAAIRNVISRVTGGESSRIDGLLRSEIGSADFYLINPQGVLFGANAQIDVPASFHVATADALDFDDGSSFSASSPDTSSLSMGSPQSFGFLDSNSASLQIQGGELYLENGDLYLSASKVEISDSSLEAPGKTIAITNPGTGGEIALYNSALSSSSDGGGFIALAAGSLSLTGSALYNHNLGAQPASGDTRLVADAITLSESLVENLAIGDGQGAGIVVISGGDLILANGSRIDAGGYAEGATGAISLGGSSLAIEGEGGGVASSRHAGSGGGGDITIDLSQGLFLANGVEINNDTHASGDSGTTRIQAQYAQLGEPDGVGYAAITSDTTGSGNAGAIQLNIQEDLILINGGYISSDVYASGNAGQVWVLAGNLYVDGGGSPFYTGLSSDALEGNGDAGWVEVEVAGDLFMRDSGSISSDTNTAGDGGGISVTADYLALDGAYITSETSGSGTAGGVVIEANILDLADRAVISSNTTGSGDAGILYIIADQLWMGGEHFSAISSDAGEGSSGAGGAVVVEVASELWLGNGAYISSDTSGDGDGGYLLITSDTLTLAGEEAAAYISSDALQGQGSAGGVAIDAGHLTIADNAFISSDTWAGGDAGSVEISVDQLTLIGGQDAVAISSDTTASSRGNAGLLDLEVARLTELYGNASISSDSYGEGLGGDIDLVTGELILDGGATISSGTSGTGNAGSVTIEVDQQAALYNGSSIDSTTEGAGSAGVILVYAENLLLDGGNDAAAQGASIASESQGAGLGGLIDIRLLEDLVLLNAASISTETQAGADGGHIYIEADRILLAGQQQNASISSSSTGATGASGDITLVSGELTLGMTSYIASDSYGEGAAGAIDISSDSLLIDGQGIGAAISTDSIGDGAGGNISLRVSGPLRIIDGGSISSDTYGDNDGGEVLIAANALELDGGLAGAGIYSETLGGIGEGGAVGIVITGDVSLRQGAVISSNSEGAGDAGGVYLKADGLRIDGASRSAGISSETADGIGNAGWIWLELAKGLTLLNDGFISTSTSSEGSAGYILIEASDIFINGNGSAQTGIASLAVSDSRYTAGEVGYIEILAERIEATNQGVISIASYGPTLFGSGDQRIAIEADAIRLSQGATISAQSQANTPAADIELRLTSDAGLRLESGAAISTAAQQADAGDITIDSGLLVLDASQITTSVSGEAGNGGDIIIANDGIILREGFIQANTAAQGASGGDIYINTPVLLMRADHLLLAGGNERYHFQPGLGVSVIQAAAPDGVSGDITLDIPEVDLAASMVPMEASFTRLPEIGENPCDLAAGETPSSLTWRGGGALPSDGMERGIATRSCQ